VTTPSTPESQPAVLVDPNITKAIAVIGATEGTSTAGLVTFTKTADGIRIEARLAGLPEGDHGFHINQFGDSSKLDGTSAGGHFNPETKPHGGPDATEPHFGDLGNITADAEGMASLERVGINLALTGTQSIVGRGVVIHATNDDLTSQPTGAAGARIGIGVIGIAEDCE
jgi:superoxide dismutase, Cu-Zn family